jgi:DNA repair protein RAD16
MCVQEYIDGSIDEHPVCPVCSVVLNIDLSAPALDVVDEDEFKRGSIINRIDMTTWRSSTKIEALVEELWKLRSRDCTIKVSPHPTRPDVNRSRLYSPSSPVSST